MSDLFRATISAVDTNGSPATYTLGSDTFVTVDGSTTVLTATGLPTYFPTAGDRLLCALVNQHLEIIQTPTLSYLSTNPGAPNRVDIIESLGVGYVKFFDSGSVIGNVFAEPGFLALIGGAVSDVELQATGPGNDVRLFAGDGDVVTSAHAGGTGSGGASWNLDGSFFVVAADIWLQAAKLAGTTVAAGQVPKFDGTKWVPGAGVVDSVTNSFQIGRYLIQWGTKSTAVVASANVHNDAVSFPTSFSATPFVWVTGTDAAVLGHAAQSASTSGFNLYSWWTDGSSHATGGSVFWLAIGLA